LIGQVLTWVIGLLCTYIGVNKGMGWGVGYSGKGTGWRKKERETQEAKYLESCPSTTSAWAG
jgi:hypothetical protein